MSTLPFITFLTTIKICKGYEFLIDRIRLYILNIQYYCKKYSIPYEILICDNINQKNICKIREKIEDPTLGKYIDHQHVKIFDMEQTYPNPHSFNMIESYGKNLCLQNARGIFCCMTSADQLFSENFFRCIKGSLQKEIFYRFATFEIPDIQVNIDDLSSVDSFAKLLAQCDTSNKRLCNPGMFSGPIKMRTHPISLGQKSGDVMLMDTESFRKIKGWPETDCFTHMDTVVCIVASNNFRCGIPPQEVCTYTFEQAGRSQESRMMPDGKQTIDEYQWNKCLSYQDKKVCN
jgi:hypothetical protein